MGISSSKSKTNTTQNQQTNQTETGTTTPLTPDYLLSGAHDYYDSIGDFASMDPNSFVAGAAPLQQQAWDNAGSLGDWRGQAATAAGMAQQAGQGGANLAGPGANTGGAMGRYAAAMGLTPNVQMSGGGSAQMPAGGGAIAGPAHSSPLPPPTNAFSGASSQQPTGLVTGQGYTPAPAQNGYAQARTGYAIGSGPAYGYNPATAQAAQIQQTPGASAYGYDPSQVSAAQIAQTPGATASNANSASLLDNLSAYQNPYDSQVRQTALSDFDQQSLQQQAQLEAQGARNGAFGGSRFGIAQGQMLGDQDRSRASLDAGLLDQGFNTAAGLSQSDAANRQAASLFNAQNQTQNSQFNSAQDAARAQAQAGFGQQASLANQSALDAAGQFNAQGQAQNSQFNSAQAAAQAAAQAQLGQQTNLANQASYDAAGQYNAGANNQMSQFNAQQQDTALNRQLASAQLLGQQANDYGTGTRADLSTMASLGDQQRAIEQAYDMAGPAQLQLAGQLAGMTPYDILVGRQVNGTTAGNMTGTGTSTTTQSPSLFSNLMQLGSTAAMFL